MSPRVKKEKLVGPQSKLALPGAKRGVTTWNMKPSDIRAATKPGEPFFQKRRSNKPVNMELVASIEQHGVIQPLEVGKVDGVVWVNAGRQRHKAALYLENAGHDIRVPVIYERGAADDPRLEGRAHAENTARVDDDPVTRAEDARDLLARSKDIELVLGSFGFVSKAAFENSQKILECCGPVREAIRDGKIPMSAAIKWAKLHNEEQKRLLAEELAKGGKITVSRATKAAKGEPQGDKLSKKLAGRIAEHAPNCAWKVSKEALALLKLFSGQITFDDAEQEIPWLGEAMDAAKNDRRKAAKARNNEAPASVAQ